ncbi:MAG: type II secretion system F family protein [Alkaliphilus sp.]
MITIQSYRYICVNIGGKRVSGTIDATSETQALNLLRESKKFPLAISEASKDSIFNEISFFGKVDTKDLAVFARQFYTMLNAGISIIEAFQVLGEQTENILLKKAIRDLSEDIQRGNTLTEAMRNNRDIFPDFFINMIEAGELSGNLEEILERVADHYEKEKKLKNKIKSSMSYPIILSVIATLIVAFLLAFVVPIFVEMFDKVGAELPALTSAIMSVSGSLVNYWYLYIGGMILAYIGKGLFAKSDFGSLFIDRTKLTIPIVKGTTKKIITARFTRTLSVLLSSGIPLLNSLDSAAKVSNNKVVELGIREVLSKVTKGETLAITITEIGVFPPMVISMIRVGEESGALDEVLAKTADFYDDEVEAEIQRMMSLIEPVMIVIMAVVVGIIVLAIVLPMFDMFSVIR